MIAHELLTFLLEFSIGTDMGIKKGPGSVMMSRAAAEQSEMTSTIHGPMLFNIIHHQQPACGHPACWDCVYPGLACK